MFQPKAVSETEEQDLAQLMAKAGQENAEVSGDEDDEEIPTVRVGSRRVPITEIDDTVIRQMTQEEKDHYIRVYQEYYSDMYD